MFKRVTIVALVVAAFLVLAVPALAFNGLRGDYTTADGCQICHSGTAGIPAVYHDWAETKHAEDEEAPSAAMSLPYGSVCAGCHTSNYAPSRVTPVPTATSSTGAVSWAASPSTTTAPQSQGNAPFSELYIGCSSCHYGANMGGIAEVSGSDPNDTAHNVPYGEMANADICGACHSRYSYTVNTYTVEPVPYLTVTTPLPGTPVTPNPNPTTLIQPQMAIGYPMLGSPAPSPSTGWNPAAPLTSYLNIPHSGWTPTPNPSATSGGLGRLQTYWKVPDPDPSATPGAVIDTLWQQTGHDGSAAQYPEWANEGHANALTVLTSQAFWGFLDEATKQECLECHSADFRIMKEAGKTVTSADVKYGITCVGCHTPHDNGSAPGAWNGEFDDQVNVDPANGSVTNGSNLCVECHNGEIPAGSTASPGTEVHHPMKEMMDGYGAIDVAAFPSVHKGKCIQCHMPPTSVSRGSVQLGGNHTFNIIKPQEAVDASPIPYATATAVATVTPSPATTVVRTTLTVTQDGMPYSACSTCHANNNGVKATPVPVSTVTATPSAGKETVTIVQNANGTSVGNMTGGDKAIWLQDTIEQRQSWTADKIIEIHSELEKAATALGYTDAAAAQAALVAVPANTWTTAQRLFLSAWTNVQYVESEGSFGLHNWDYSREIVNKALQQAKEAQTGVVVKLPWVVTFSLSKSSINAGAKVTFSGTVKTAKGVAGAGKVNIMKRVSGVWKVWQTVSLKANGSYSLTKKMTTEGTFYMRALMPGDSANLAGTSTPNRKLVVK